MKGIATPLLKFFTVLFAGLPLTGLAQLQINSPGTPYVVDFTGFDGSGFDPNPGTGQLDSDTWSVTGLSDGDVPFGGSGASGDFARGSSTGGEITGGIYSFDNGITGEMLGVQPTGSDFTNGDFRLRIENNTGDTLYELDIDYSVWVYNDEDRSNSLNLSYSFDNSAYTALPSLDFVSPEAADASPTWNEAPRDTTLGDLKLPPGDSLYLKWEGDDVGGSGSRDEFGIDDVQLVGRATSLDVGFTMNEDTVCEGTLVDYTDTTQIQNDSIVSWEWDFDNGDTSMQQNPTYDHGNPGSYNIKLVVTTDSGNVDSSAQTLVVDTADDASFAYDTTAYCDQDGDPTPTISGDAGGTFSEGTGDLSLDASTGTIDLSASVPGTYTVFYETSDECPNAETFEVEVVDQYDATIDPVDDQCDKDTVIDLIAPHEGGNWSGPGVVNDSTGGFNPSVAGVDTHEVIHEIPGACGDSDTIDIVVIDQLDATIDSAGPYCLPSTTDVLSAGDGGGTWSGPGIVDPSAGEFSPNDAGEGTHTITYEISGSCGDIDSIDIVVDSSADATIDPAGPYCETSGNKFLTAADSGGIWYGNGIVDSLNGEFDPGEAGPGNHSIVYEIEGDCGDLDTEGIEIFEGNDGAIDSTGVYCEVGPIDTLTAVDTGGVWSGPGIIDQNEGAFDPSDAGPGIHEIVHSYPSGDSCDLDDTTMIEVTEQADASIDSVGTLCTNEGTDTLTAADSGGVWSGPGIVDSLNGAFDPDSAGTGTHSITYHVDTGQTCGNSDTIDITVADPPTADFGYSKDGFEVEFSDSSNGSTGYYWEFGDGNSSSDQNPTHTYSDDTLYTACQFVFNDDGCSDTLCKEIDLQDVAVRSYEEENAFFEVNPNPAREEVFLRFDKVSGQSEKDRIQILDLSGRTVQSQSISDEGSRERIELSGLAKGAYILRVRIGDEFGEKKLIVR